MIRYLVWLNVSYAITLPSVGKMSPAVKVPIWQSVQQIRMGLSGGQPLQGPSLLSGMSPRHHRKRVAHEPQSNSTVEGVWMWVAEPSPNPPYRAAGSHATCGAWGTLHKAVAVSWQQIQVAKPESGTVGYSPW